MKCINVVKSALNTWSKCHKGPTSRANQQKLKIKKKKKKKSHTKNLTKIKLSNPHLRKTQL